MSPPSPSKARNPDKAPRRRKAVPSASWTLSRPALAAALLLWAAELAANVTPFASCTRYPEAHWRQAHLPVHESSAAVEHPVRTRPRQFPSSRTGASSRAGSCILVGGYVNGTLAAIDFGTGDRLRWRLALFRQVSTEEWPQASHSVQNLAFDSERRQVYVSALVSRSPFAIEEPIGPGQAPGFLAAYAWPSLELLWRIWADDGVGGPLIYSASSGLLYSGGRKMLAAIDPATGEVLGQLGQAQSIFALFTDPDRPGSLYVVLQNDATTVRLRELEEGTLRVITEREFPLPTAGRLNTAGFDPSRKVLHLLPSSRWQMADLTGSFRADQPLSLPGVQWLFLPGPNLPLVFTCCPWFGRAQSQLLAADEQGSLRAVWTSEPNVGAFGATTSADGSSVLLITAPAWIWVNRPAEIIAVNPETGVTRSLASFGSLRDVGRVLDIAEPCPEVRVPVGDCNADSEVTVEEVIRSVDIALDGAPVNWCPAIDQDGNNAATIDELIAAVACILSPCG